MIPYFADTSFYVALLGPSDVRHQKALVISEEYIGRVVTTDYVLVELGSMLCDPIDRPAYLTLIRSLQSDPFVEILPASAELAQCRIRFVCQAAG